MHARVLAAGMFAAGAATYWACFWIVTASPAAIPLGGCAIAAERTREPARGIRSGGVSEQSCSPFHSLKRSYLEIDLHPAADDSLFRLVEGLLAGSVFLFIALPLGMASGLP